MLKSLYIKNYAIIEQTTLNFDNKFNVITGETGAGKSILVGALSLVLGARADSSVVNLENGKCIVEACFNLNGNHLKPFFEQHELDYNTETIIRREISEQGKSRAFINDTPVNLTVLRSIGANLVNLHSQHETLQLAEPNFQLSLLDYVAGHEQLLQQYANEYATFTSLNAELKRLENQQTKTNTDLDYKLFQLNEIKEAQLDGFEIDELENELQTLERAEEIKQAMAVVAQAIQNDNFSLENTLQEMLGEMSSIAQVNAQLQQLNERLNSTLIELRDVANEAENIADNTELDEEKIAIYKEKTNLAHKLLKKHNVATIAQLLNIQATLEAETLSVDDVQQAINKLNKAVLAQQKVLQGLATNLNKGRQDAAKICKQKIEAVLIELAMQNSVVEFQFTTLPQFIETGLDEVEIYFNANKGFAPQPLSKVASGGELSRLMLAVKSIIAETSKMPTLIFDEIDTGISGETAAKVGSLIKAMASHNQIISITHLPQIAGKGHKHFFVQKADTEHKTITVVNELEGQKRVEAIARMLSGEQITPSALQNAQNLLN